VSFSFECQKQCDAPNSSDKQQRVYVTAGSWLDCSLKKRKFFDKKKKGKKKTAALLSCYLSVGE
jgi:hypothetical protein